MKLSGYYRAFIKGNFAMVRHLIAKFENLQAGEWVNPKHANGAAQFNGLQVKSRHNNNTALKQPVDETTDTATFKTKPITQYNTVIKQPTALQVVSASDCEVDTPAKDATTLLYEMYNKPFQFIDYQDDMSDSDTDSVISHDEKIGVLDDEIEVLDEEMDESDGTGFSESASDGELDSLDDYSVGLRLSSVSDDETDADDDNMSCLSDSSDELSLVFNNRMDKNELDVPFTRLVVTGNDGRQQFMATMLNSVPDEVLQSMAWSSHTIEELPQKAKGTPLSAKALSVFDLSPNEIADPDQARYLGEGGNSVVRFAILENYPEKGESHFCVAKKLKVKEEADSFEELKDSVEAEIALQNEAQELAPAIHGFTETEDKNGNKELVVFMDAAKGLDGFSFIYANALSFNEQKALMASLLSAVIKLHKKNITHGDLKWENVFIDRGSETGRFDVQLIDFGLASKNPELNGIYSTCNSYLAPETVSDITKGKAMDTYSLGVMMVSLFQREDAINPFIHDDDYNSRLWSDEDTPELIEEMIASYLSKMTVDHDKIKGIIEQMVKRHPDDRPALDDIKAALQSIKG